MIEAEVEVDETDIPTVMIGQPAKIKIDAFPDKTFPGKVTEVGNSPITTAGQATRATNFKVVVTIDGVVPDVRPGFTCTAEITTATRQKAVSVPIQATTVREVILDAAGAVAGSERRTAADSYGVFTESPGVAAQTTVSGPGGGNAASPNGWLTGSQTTVNISGNNANAYLDRDANNGPDGGGTAVTNGVFDAVAGLAVDVVDHDLGAFLGVALDDAFAEARAAAGNDRHLVLETHAAFPSSN